MEEAIKEIFKDWSEENLEIVMAFAEAVRDNPGVVDAIEMLFDGKA